MLTEEIMFTSFELNFHICNSPSFVFFEMCLLCNKNMKRVNTDDGTEITADINKLDAGAEITPMLAHLMPVMQ